MESFPVRSTGGYLRVAVLLAAILAGSAGSLQAQLAGRVQGGYGTGTGYGGMFGGSIGIEFPLLFGNPAYVGPWVLYNAGETFEREDETLTQKSTFLGIEGGGVFLKEPIMIRGAGNIAAAFITTDPEGGVRESETRLDLSGGVAFGKQFGQFFVAVEPYTFLIINSDRMGGSFALYLTVGFRPGD